MVACSLCGSVVPSGETCRQETCRACHKSLSLEECRKVDEEVAAALEAGDVGEAARLLREAYP